ncbi:Protein saf4 [Elasticomyces elasticus]|nr:Protein saf4 [Elasticomyces elasticus]KAK3663463.1 Protein saf4 [Elasticomyces elasticus]KAK4927152.1 Protein saf4 [Elasticomyces elasticus]KAK5768984.1 Protein saf4 [Elasticomyces elasticus]
MQGFNMGRYVPPDLEGTASGNNIHKKRAPGTLRKDRTQTVRFEMPYAVFCHTCKPAQIIGQGVRFNAIKTRVGNYFSTPIWQFTLKHTACGGAIEITTDPKNTAYVVTKGGKARDYGDHDDRARKEGEGGMPILTAEERERRRDDAFAQLEGEVDEKQAVKDNSKRIEELYRSGERDWDDPWAANKRMRTSFRHARKARKREEDATEALKARLGTDNDLLPGTEEDATRAKLVTFGDVEGQARSNAANKALFEKRPPSSHIPAPSKVAKESRKDALRRQLIGNTRAALDPFADPG